MSNLDLVKAALKNNMDKRVVHKPNVLKAEAKGTASKQAFEAKSGNIDQLDLDYLDSLNRITGTLKNEFVDSLSASKVTSGTFLGTNLTLAGTEASNNKSSLVMIGDALMRVNDGATDRLKMSNAGIEISDSGNESADPASVIGRGIFNTGSHYAGLWPFYNPNRRGWNLRADGVGAGGVNGHIRIIATQAAAATSVNTGAWASLELNVEGRGAGVISGYAGAIIQNMLWVVGPARIGGSLDVSTNLRVSNSSDLDGATYLNGGIARRDAANLQFNRGVDINSGDLRFTNTGTQGIRSVGGQPLDLHAIGSFVRMNQSLRAIAGLVVIGPTSLEGLGVSGNVTLPNDSIDNAMLKSHVTDNTQRSVGENHIFDSLRNPSQNTHGLRNIGALLGGTALNVASGNHGHSSGSTMNIDRIPVADRRRVLAYRKQLLADLADLRTLTVSELYTFVENLANVALDALSFAIDAPDIDADKRQALRDAGEYVSENWEFRESERREKSGPASAADEPNYFDTQPHYLGPTLPPSIRRANRPDTPTKAKRP